ncbi:MAG: hypothetical protein Alpg2KO_23520 [Alphaproteobacteria bacterium]
MILIPRAAAELGETCAAFEAQGWQTVASPLQRVSWVPTPQRTMPDGPQGLILTSKNGLRGWLRSGQGTDLPVWAVGQATAQAASQAGFGTVTTGPGDAPRLAEMIRASLPSSDAPLVHACEQTAGQGLVGRLQDHVPVLRWPCYRTSAVQHLNPVAVSALQANAVTHIALFSPRMARAVVPALAQAGLLQKTQHLCLLCMSDKIADAANAPNPDVRWAKVLIADRPDLNTLTQLDTPYPHVK